MLFSSKILSISSFSTSSATSLIVSQSKSNSLKALRSSSVVIFSSNIILQLVGLFKIKSLYFQTIKDKSIQYFLNTLSWYSLAIFLSIFIFI
ncbi:MAG: hypothetical protein LBQ24_06950 [Candidatus Peribacteria bacterium]|nr:hypothetical protein [Candidatus Peribacteria bacterium]